MLFVGSQIFVAGRHEPLERRGRRDLQHILKNIKLLKTIIACNCSTILHYRTTSSCSCTHVSHHIRQQQMSYDLLITSALTHIKYISLLINISKSKSQINNVFQTLDHVWRLHLKIIQMTVFRLKSSINRNLSTLRKKALEELFQ